MNSRCAACARPWPLLLAPAGDLCDSCVVGVCDCIARGTDAASFWPWTVRSAPSASAGGSAEARTHLDLAFAYSQMGMLADALAACATAVLAAPERDVIAHAWRFIVDPRVCVKPQRVYELARRLADGAGSS